MARNLSDETRRELDEELVEISGGEGTSDELPETQPVREAGVVADRGGVLLGGLVLAIIVGAVASAWAGSWWLVAVALALYALGVGAIFFLAAGLLGQFRTRLTEARGGSPSRRRRSRRTGCLPTSPGSDAARTLRPTEP